MKICFVCSANVCRSYVSEMLLNSYACTEKLDITAISGGVYAQSHFAVPQKIKDYLTSKNIKAAKHVSHLISGEDITASDLVLVMEHSHHDILTDKYSQYTDRIRLYLDYIFNEDADVSDPISETGEKFERAMDKLDSYVKALIAKLKLHKLGAK